MSELIYREVVAVAGFDPAQDLTAPWSLTDAKRRLHLPAESGSAADTTDQTRLLEALIGEVRPPAAG
jgi:hypothetical protein